MSGDDELAREDTRCGFVALIGAPNAGKSTLVNRLVGAKVSIVTHKVQTTRALVRGIAIEGAAQIVFVDTPGIFKPKRRLDRAMVATAWGGAARRRHRRAADRRRARASTSEADAHARRRLERRQAAEGAGPQQDRHGQARKAAGAGADAATKR